MAGERITGLPAAYALLARVPEAARFEFADMLGRFGRDELLDQQAAVARDTGALAGELTSQLDTERLRVRIGLIGIKNRRSGKRRLDDAFYGRFVERGRRAQTVVVTRRIAKSRRRTTGNGKTSSRTVTYRGQAGARLRRRGPNKGTPIGSPYKMKVLAMAARPFVHRPGAESRLIVRTANFWAGVLERAGGGA